MKPTENELTTKIFKLPGGTADNDLPVQPWDAEAGTRVHTSFWVPSEAELIQLEDGATIALSVWGLGHPPVALGIGPDASDEAILASVAESLPTHRVGEAEQAAWDTAVEAVTQGDGSTILDGDGRVVAVVLALDGGEAAAKVAGALG